MSEQHVTHLLSAYVHHQLGERRSVQVRRHLRVCPACRLALSREEALANDLRRTLPAFGAPEPGQLRRLWPSVRVELASASPILRIAPSVSVVFMMLLICAFSISAILGGTSQAIAAPDPQVPADIRATNTPFHTDEPRQEAGEATLTASQTASAYTIIPKPSPAPPAAQLDWQTN